MNDIDKLNIEKELRNLQTYYSLCFNCDYLRYEKFKTCPICNSNIVGNYPSRNSNSILLAIGITRNIWVRLAYNLDYISISNYEERGGLTYYWGIDVKDIPKILLNISLRYNTQLSIHKSLKEFIDKYCK